MKFRKTLVGLCGLALLSAPISNVVQFAQPTTVFAEEAVEEAAPTYDFEYEEFTDGVTRFGLVSNPNDGPDITFSLDSGINILTEEVDGETYYFKDFNNNNELEVFEDWREDATTRAEAMSQAISIDQAAGLMLFSSHERDQAAGLTDDQKTYLENDDLRNVLHAGPNNSEDSVTWSNQFQAFVETLGSEEEPVIPVNFSSDPRSVAGNVTAYNADGADISRWPSNLGIAATFNPDVMEEFSVMSSEEYRALGITMALGPQIELATEPRWLRVDGTFGEDAQLSTDMTKAYINFSQSSYDDEGNDLGWGETSVAMMAKHYPGDGPGESGRESHTFEGKFAVFPGGNKQEHIDVFINGGLDLEGETGAVSSMMTSYSIQLDAEGNPLYGEEFEASAYNEDLVQDLRDTYDFDGILVTDWGVTGENTNTFGEMGSSYGHEGTTDAEKHFEIVKAGIDMFGGNNAKQPVLDAYDLWEEAYENGELEQSADERFRDSARRILTTFFNVGVFENPYLDLENSQEVLASEDKVEAGYQAQLDSVVMLKNSDNTIQAVEDAESYKDMTVYIPSTMRNPFDNVFGEGVPFAGPSLSVEVASEYFGEVITDTEITDEEGNVTGFEQPENLDNVDLVLVGMASPDNGDNFSNAGVEEDGSTYYPLSLQYRPYTADNEFVRETSIGGDILEDGSKENRSYFGNTSKISNEYDLDAVLNTKELVEASGADIPIIVAMEAKNPVVMSEFEADVDAIVVGFQISHNALFEVMLGLHEPQGLLPIQFPADMETVEEQLEDVAHDMTPYEDSDGNVYDFGFGLNYGGQIEDDRTSTYVTKE